MKKPRHKYNAVRTEVNGRKYASKAEARFASNLADNDKVLGWLEQVPFRFSCGSKYLADFLIFYHDGSCELVDVKGVETAIYKLKAKMMADEYPWIPLVVVKGRDVP